MTLFDELRRRHVFRGVIAYVAISWLLIEALQLITEVFAAPDWLMRGIVIAFAAGLVPAAVLSWMYEVTSEGLVAEAEAETAGLASIMSDRRFDYAIIGVLAVALTLLLVERQTDTSLIEGGKVAAVAVLPFEDFSSQGDQRGLGDGIADTLIKSLSQVKDLAVTARTSSFAFRDRSGVSIADIGDDLGVDAVLDGSVQRSGDKLRIIAQLVRVSDQTNIWARTFDRSVGDIFEVQDEIAAAVRSVVSDVSGDDQDIRVAGTSSIEAYEHFIRGTNLWEERSRESVESSIEAFDAALRLDPEYAEAHVGLARAHLFSAIYGGRRLEEVRVLVERELERGLALDPDIADGYAVRALLDGADGDLAAREANLRRAIELNPSNVQYMLQLGGTIVSKVGENDEARELLRRAYALDPLNEYVIGSYASVLAWRGETHRAIEVLTRGLERYSDSVSIRRVLLDTYSDVGRLADAVVIALEAIELAPGSAVGYASLADALVRLEREADAEPWMERAIGLSPNVRRSPYWFLDDDPAVLLTAVEQELVRSPDDPLAMQEATYGAIIAGDLDQAAARSERLWAYVAPEGVMDGNVTLWPAVMRAHIARSRGDERLASELIEEVEAALSATDRVKASEGDRLRLRAISAAISGDADAVRAGLDRMVSSGFCALRELQAEPWWAPYRQEPWFIAIVERIEDRLAEERDRLPALEGIQG